MAIYATVSVDARLPAEVMAAGALTHAQTYLDADDVEHYEITAAGRLLAGEVDAELDGPFEFFVMARNGQSFDLVATFDDGQLGGIEVEARYAAHDEADELRRLAAAMPVPAFERLARSGTWLASVGLGIVAALLLSACYQQPRQAVISCPPAPSTWAQAVEAAAECELAHKRLVGLFGKPGREALENQLTERD